MVTISSAVMAGTTEIYWEGNMEDRYSPIGNDGLSIDYALSIALPGAAWVLDKRWLLTWRMIRSTDDGKLIQAFRCRDGAIMGRSISREVTVFAHDEPYLPQNELRVHQGDVLWATLLWVKDKSQPKEYILSVDPTVRSVEAAIASTWRLGDNFNPTQHT